jgi:pimeloyl-ACP methyl ester carboxylesterase
MPALFLHGGPGFHARVERAWFGDRLPIHWWDQPAIAAEDRAPMRTLVDAAATELDRLAHAAGGPVSLVAHSFGGQIARALAEAMPGSIDRIVLLGSPFDPVDAHLRFAKSLVNAGADTPELVRALDGVSANVNPDSLLGVVSASFGVPGALRHYFAKDSEAVAQRYLEQLLQGPIIDFGTLASVLRDCMRAPPPATRSPFTGRVQLLSGTTDPICAGGSDAVGWQAVFPRARYRAVPSGHMVHVELAPDIWFGQAPDAAAAGATTATA